MSDVVWFANRVRRPRGARMRYADPAAQTEIDRLRAKLDQIRTVHDDTIDQHALFCDSHHKRARDCNCWRAVLDGILNPEESK